MLIDWFTVFAQVFNFLILVWLMKRFLYKPILHAIDQREERIAKELADAGAEKAQAQKERAKLQQSNEEFDRSRTTLLKQAAEEAKAERLRLIEEARLAADTVGKKRQEALISAAENLNETISRRTKQQVFAIARKTLADMASITLEECIIDVFIRRLDALSKEEKELLANTLKRSTVPLNVRTALDLPSALRHKAENAIKTILACANDVRFTTDAALISGIELSVDGHKVAWSIADYLASIEVSISELLKSEEPKPKSKNS